MDPARHIVRLNPHGMSWSTYLGGKAEISTSDVAAAIGRVPSRCGQALLLASWTDDSYSTRIALDSALSMFTRAARDWRVASEQRLALLAALAVSEVVSAPLCARCQGRGQIAKTNGAGLLVCECDACLGFGLRTLSQRERARRVRVDHQSWRRRWQDRYLPVLRHLANEHDGALRVVKRMLSDP